jgi:hypothetical protein
MVEKNPKSVAAGKARAASMTSDERSAIASSAVKARWARYNMMPKATHTGKVKIGDFTLRCAILEDGTRILSESSITSILGSRSGGAKQHKKEWAAIPLFLASKALKPFINNELQDGPLSPIYYAHKRRILIGYDAKILPTVCDIWLQARQASVLHPNQLPKAQNAEILMRSLAHVGIVALVDEATGYQDERDKDELSKLLSIYLSEERLAWAKQFPDEFYKQIYRLKGWSYPDNTQRPRVIGKITNKIVYDHLPPGVLEELRTKNPTCDRDKRRKFKHHQYLSPDIGQKDLREHLLQVIALMRTSRNWEQFEDHMKAVFPKHGDQMILIKL